MGQGYTGQQATHCQPIEQTYATVVVVSGASWNPCGHGLLYWGNDYYHVSGSTPFMWGAPALSVIPGNKFGHYLTSNGKTVLRRITVEIPRPEAAYRELQALMDQNYWVWLGIPNNCFHFLERVLQAGGGDYSLITNCHLLEGAR